MPLVFEGIEVTKGIIRYEQEARIVLFTDGLSEWLDDEEQDGIAKIRQGLQSSGSTHDPEGLVERIYPHDKSGAPQDDMCLVMISIS